MTAGAEQTHHPANRLLADRSHSGNTEYCRTQEARSRRIQEEDRPQHRTDLWKDDNR